MRIIIAIIDIFDYIEMRLWNSNYSLHGRVNKYAIYK